jgi:hypothetical protein
MAECVLLPDPQARDLIERRARSESGFGLLRMWQLWMCRPPPVLEEGQEG